MCVSVLRLSVLFTLVSTKDSELKMTRNACFANRICQSWYQLRTGTGILCHWYCSKFSVPVYTYMLITKIVYFVYVPLGYS